MCFSIDSITNSSLLIVKPDGLLPKEWRGYVEEMEKGGGEMESHTWPNVIPKRKVFFQWKKKIYFFWVK